MYNKDLKLQIIISVSSIKIPSEISILLLNMKCILKLKVLIKLTTTNANS